VSFAAGLGLFQEAGKPKGGSGPAFRLLQFLLDTEDVGGYSGYGGRDRFKPVGDRGIFGGPVMRKAVVKQIVSRMLAVLLLAFPLALGGLSLDREELELIDRLTAEEYVSHVRENLPTSSFEAFLIVTVLPFLYLVAVEFVAYLIRKGWGLLAKIVPSPN